MTEFLTTIFEFPVVAFTVPLAFVLLYWCFVLLGAAEIDMFDPDGVFEGAVDAVDGAFDAAEGVGAEGGPEIELADGADAADGVEGASGIGRVLAVLGIAGVPLTVSISLIVIIGWLVTYGLTQWLSDGGGGEGIAWLPALGVLAAGLAGGTVAAAGAAKPLRPVFHVHLAKESRSFVGSTCTVTTLRVDDSFGQAEIVDGGAGLLVQVRCSRANNLTKGSQALVFDYKPEDGVFLVTPLDGALAPDDAGAVLPISASETADVTEIDIEIERNTDNDPTVSGPAGRDKRTKES